MYPPATIVQRTATDATQASGPVAPARLGRVGADRLGLRGAPDPDQARRAAASPARGGRRRAPPRGSPRRRRRRAAPCAATSTKPAIATLHERAVLAVVAPREHGQREHHQPDDRRDDAVGVLDDRVEVDPGRDVAVAERPAVEARPGSARSRARSRTRARSRRSRSAGRSGAASRERAAGTGATVPSSRAGQASERPQATGCATEPACSPVALGDVAPDVLHRLDDFARRG